MTSQSAVAQFQAWQLPDQCLWSIQICIIGAGKMSRLLVKHLVSKDCGEIILLNRSLPRAQALAEEFPTVAFSIRLMPELMQSVAESDVIFAASGAGVTWRHVACQHGILSVKGYRQGWCCIFYLPAGREVVQIALIFRRVQDHSSLPASFMFDIFPLVHLIF